MSPNKKTRDLLQFITAAAVLAESPAACVAGLIIIAYLIWEMSNDSE